MEQICHDTFHPRPYIKISDTVVFGIPRSASSSHTASCQSLLIEAHTCSTFSGILLVAGLPECGSPSVGCLPSLKNLCHTFICAALITLSQKAFWIMWIVSAVGCSSLAQNLMQIHCSTHSAILNAMATEHTCSLNGVYHPLLTSTVKPSSFTYMHIKVCVWVYYKKTLTMVLGREPVDILETVCQDTLLILEEERSVSPKLIETVTA